MTVQCLICVEVARVLKNIPSFINAMKSSLTQSWITFFDRLYTSRFMFFFQNRYNLWPMQVQIDLSTAKVFLKVDFYSGRKWPKLTHDHSNSSQTAVNIPGSFINAKKSQQQTNLLIKGDNIVYRAKSSRKPILDQRSLQPNLFSTPQYSSSLSIYQVLIRVYTAYFSTQQLLI